MINIEKNGHGHHLTKSRELSSLWPLCNSRVFIVIDALDECQASDGCQARFLSEIFNLQVKAQSKHLCDFEIHSRDHREVQRKHIIRDPCQRRRCAEISGWPYVPIASLCRSKSRAARGN